MTMKIADRWAELFLSAPTERVLSTSADLLRRYAEGHRKYHTPEHLDACFAELTKTGYGEANVDVVDAALLCHDIFYDTRAVNNEGRSAVWCRNATSWLGRRELGMAAAECILATRHDGGYETSPEAALVCDVDLSILGALPEVYDEYEKQIREEYSWVPEDRFRAGRSGILTGLISKPIYHTHVYQEKYAVRARANVVRSLARLAGQ